VKESKCGSNENNHSMVKNTQALNSTANAASPSISQHDFQTLQASAPSSSINLCDAL
jgi:hypothetical protein